MGTRRSRWEGRKPPPAGAEGFRRRDRALASFVEAGRALAAPDDTANLCRHLLLAAIGMSGSRSGAVFLRTNSTATLAEAFGPWETARDAAPLALDWPASEIDERTPVRVLPAQEGNRLQAWIRSVLPSFEPCVFVCLEARGGPCGFLLLGRRADGEEHGNDDLISLTTLAGIFAILSEKIEFSLPSTGSRRAARNDRGTRRGLDQMRLTHPALRRCIGNSAAMERILFDLLGVTSTNYPLLLEGASGTGKELLARIAHEIAVGEDAPFEAISCAAIPETLFESELFGHVAGSFTGATRDHRGLFERAQGGTVFLDEIGDMPPSAQVKLLRVLQEEKYLPVGGETLKSCGSRIIAATNCDLRSLVREGNFRQDLYYRLNVFPIRLPPLLERKGDIALLLEHFLEHHSVEMGRVVPSVQPPAFQRLTLYSYPGNVRELQNVVRALLVESRGAAEITDEHVIAVFSRHRLDAPPMEAHQSGQGVMSDIPSVGQDVGLWVRGQLRRYHFNIALAERMLESERSSTPDHGAVPVFSRSGLTYYLQGECLRALAQEDWDRDAAARRIAGRPDLVSRTRSKLDRFLEEALRTLRGSAGTSERGLHALRRRFSKLPACYADDLQRLAEAFAQGTWSGPVETPPGKPTARDAS